MTNFAAVASTGGGHRRRVGQPIPRAIRALRQRGPLRALQSVFDVVEDKRFDLRNGVVTHGVHELIDLEIHSPNSAHGSTCMPVRVGHLRRVFRALPIDPTDWTLVDLGAGDGRVLFAADEFGFGRAIGIEFAEELCRAAEANRASFEKKHKRHPRIEIRHADATSLDRIPEPAVFYAYNPFDAEVMAQVARRIAELRAGASTQPSWFCYTNAAFPALIDEIPGAAWHSEVIWGGETSAIWSL